jgi:hypothetical protein
VDAQLDEPGVGATATGSTNGVDAHPEPFSATLLRRYRAVIGGRSQRLLADRIGIDHAILSRWERGRGNIRLSTVDRIVRWVEQEEQRAATYASRAPQRRTSLDPASLD